MAFLGASLTDAAVAPDVLTDRLRLPMPAFVAGTNGADPLLLEVWSRALVRIARPGVAIIGIGPGDLASDNRWRAEQLVRSPQYRRTTGAPDDRSSWARALESLEERLRWIPIVKWRWNLRELKFVPPMTPLGHDTTYGDTVMASSTSPLPAHDGPDDATPMMIADREHAALVTMVRRFQRSGARVALMTMPISATNAAAQGNRQRTGYRSLLRSVSQELGIALIEVDHRIGYDDRYFADGLHMNRVGATAFSRALADELETNHPDLLAAARAGSR